jgi:hemolysin III
LATAEASPESQPLLRGVSHGYSFFLSLIVGAALIAGAQTTRATVAAAIFAATVASMFGASALYHRVRWTPSQRRWMRRVDHAGIFLVIAGSYTPYALIVFSGSLRLIVLALVWAAVLSAIALRFAWVSAPGWIAVATGLAIGWLSLIALPQLIDRVSPGGLALLGAGGLLYTAGAVVYAIRRPDPAPTVFGYHEVFHALIVAAVACQYASIAFFLLPGA